MVRLRDIAGILSDNRRVLGMMPHPERAADSGHGGTDGQRVVPRRLRISIDHCMT